MNTQKRVGERFDWTLAFILFLFFIVSCFAISSAQTSGQYSTNFVVMQIAWYVVGGIIIGMSILLDPDQYRKLAWYLYGFGILLLILLIFAPESIAEPRNGAKSWFTLPGIGSIQPSEFMKTFLILATSRLIVDHHQKYIYKTLKTDGLLLFKIIGVSFIPLALIMQQPDLGTGLVIVAITIGLIFVSGITWKIILPAFSIFAITAGTILSIAIWKPEVIDKFVDDYQFGRIYSWLDPYSYQTKEGFHLIKSLQAIGSGEITGKGYNSWEVDVPERHTDFIFSVIGEEFGFIGSSIVISLYFLLIYHLIKVALDTRSQFNAYLCAGIISMTTFHVFQNIGMTVGLLPITGIPLPFISYGGSSLMGNMLALGIIFSIRFYHRNYMFSTNND